MRNNVLAMMLLAAASSAIAMPDDLAGNVNPFIGCAWNGHTYPGPTLPFGSVQPGPDSGNGDWQHCSGYVHADTNIYGFSQTHLSGTGCADMGDVRLLPFAGELPSDLYPLKDLKGAKDFASEKAEVGYYSVKLPELGVLCEVAAGQRVAFHRWTKLDGRPFHVLVDPQWGQLWLQHKMAGHILAYSGKVSDDHRTITGGFRHRSWLRREIHFKLVFDRPWRELRELPAKSGEKAPRYVLDFDLAQGERLGARIAISTVDDEGAAKNLEAERHLDFDNARSNARLRWNELFARQQIPGSSAAEKTNFYTALYHLCLQPNEITDADGRYRGANREISRAPTGKPRYTGFSLWDTFRAAHPLYTLLVPERVGDFVASMVESYQAIGFLPVIEFGGCESYCMIGNHAVPVVVDAYLKGFGGFDAKIAYQAVVNSLTHTHSTPDRGLKIKEDWNLLNRFGYYPYDLIEGESVSRTLECAYDDACAARFAKAMGDDKNYRFFTQRAANWTNLLDRSLGLVRGKDSQGKWREPFDPYRFGGGGEWAQYDCTEGNAWQYTWSVMQDPEALIAALGGKEQFAKRLDSVFRQREDLRGGATVADTTGLIGQYVHGNEPSHHIAYFYPFADRPDRTAEIVREVCDRFYLPSTDGLCGNDDCGQMSAWYVFAALGFYPFDPCGGEFVLGAPQLPKTVTRLPDGKTFTVIAKNLSRENKYVKSVSLNGKPMNGFKLQYRDIMAGGELVFEMAATPPQRAARTMAKGPEIWYYAVGGNFTREGITADLEAIAKAGFSGIQFLHVGRGEALCVEKVPQIPCMSERWEEMMRFLGEECKRLGLRLVLQNCPGWSQSGGPWITPDRAMRDIKCARGDFEGGAPMRIEVPKKYRDRDSDWRDVAVLAFPTPKDDTDAYLTPTSVETNGAVLVFNFSEPVTIRTIELAGGCVYNHDYVYNEPWLHLKFDAIDDAGRRHAAVHSDLPVSSWRDYIETLSVACNELTAKRWRYELTHDLPMSANPPPRFRSAARQTNWEMKSGRVLRSLMRGVRPKQAAETWVDPATIVDLTERLAADGTISGSLPAGRWTVLRFGHVNAKHVNAPAPKEATGWECDKLARGGIEQHYAGFIGKLHHGALAGGLMNGMFVDSWECFGQTWTPKMEAEFAAHRGYPLRASLPALFGWVIGSPEKTELFLRDWRETLGELITQNYYGRMAELAHADDLESLYETAFGDIISGDLLEYWKFCDAPMCEFWYPMASPQTGGVGSYAFKSIRPCASAAHVYGKRRVCAEALTSGGLFWREELRGFKDAFNHYFARGVTHMAVCSYSHNPSVNQPPPGNTNGGYNGCPQSRLQTWWHGMGKLTDYARDCEERLEWGLPVSDVLWYLGDAFDHKPDVNCDFPEGFKYDYVNRDVLFNRLKVVNGVFVNPEGTSWRVLWVPDEYLMRDATRRRLNDLSSQGGRVVFGGLDALRQALAGVMPDLLTSPRLGEAPTDDFAWIHRVDGKVDRYFIAAGTNGWRGMLKFRAKGPARVYDPVTKTVTRWNGGAFSLCPSEARFFDFGVDLSGIEPPTESVKIGEVKLQNWALSYPANWGAPDRISLAAPCDWSTIATLSPEARSFSGTAAYSADFTLKRAPAATESLVLDLGRVESLARVFVNDHEVACLWCEPYRCDLAKFVKRGRNALRVEVTSTWHNRIVYDAGLPDGERKTALVRKKHFTPEPGDPLEPAGWLGPVALEMRNVR